MKMKYQKPMIAVEQYELSQSIVACSIKISMASNSCVRRDSDTPDEMRSIAFNYPMYFAQQCDGSGELDVVNGSGIPKDALCYHTQTNATFTS